jgi:type VI secretion system secreted protein VgrG
MADGATQDQRVGVLATPLGKDKLLLSRFEGVEGMGEFFEFRVEALSSDASIDFDKALGRNSSVHLRTSDGSGRDFSGVLTQARSLGKRGDYYGYSLVLRPWLWLLSLTSDCRIFPNMKPKDIIKQVFEDRGFNDVLDLAVQEYPTLEYTVQYRETDLNFVLRLMEEYGIYYYFKFMPGDGSSPSTHYLVLADSTTHDQLPSPTEVIFLPPTAGEQRGKQQFNDWSKSNAMVSGVFTLNDYDYEKPGKDLLEKAQHSYQFEHGSMEIYNYPGGYDDPEVGMNMAKVSRDAERTRNQRWSASGYAPSLTPGFTINRTSTNGDPDDGDYLLLRCTHAYGVQTYQSAAGAPAGEIYSGAYELAKSDIPFRMPLHTRKPVIAGSQSALVVGEKGEEIDVDKEGRILVQFYWDRKKKQSRRVRVAQIWAGAHRGALFLPRIGDEVMIQYEEGDPDRPLVVGSVYNGDNKVSAKLPEKKTYSGILTKSSKNSNGYNMFLFDDTAGKERVKLRAQRDLMFKALNNEQRDINGSQTENIGGDETITVGGPKGGGNFTVNAFQTITLNVGPIGAPMTKIVMDMNGILLSAGMGISSVYISAAGVNIMGPNVNVTAMAAVNILAPTVNVGLVLNTPELNAGAGTVGGILPLL